MKQKFLFLSLLFCIALCSCKPNAPNLHNCFSFVNHTNDSIIKIEQSVRDVKDPQIVDYTIKVNDTIVMSAQIYWADHCGDHVNIIYDGKRHCESSKSGNSIMNKDAYKYVGTVALGERTYNHYCYELTEEYILSLPIVDSY